MNRIVISMLVLFLVLIQTDSGYSQGKYGGGRFSKISHFIESLVRAK